MMLTKLMLVTSFLAVSCHGANILAFPVSNSYSHFTVMEPLFLELAARGHHLTVVSSFPQKQPLPNYHDINVGPLLRPVHNNLNFQHVLKLGDNPFSNMVKMLNIGTEMCESILKSGTLKELYNSTIHYDLIITHIFAYECFSVFAHKFEVPIVSVVTSSALPWSNSRVGNPDHPAYVVNNFIDAHEDMNLYQRTLNTLTWLWSTIAIHPIACARSNKLVSQYLDPTAPPVQSLIKKTSLVMVNSHFSLLQSRPFVPNFVEIAGIHVKDPKPLPKDLQEFLDSSLQGVIVFSLGSHVRVSSMGNSTLQAFMDAFASMPQRVIFKFEETIENAPLNVLVRKWLPQRDILEHPNVKVLMGHGGQSSTIEAVHTGTPMVGMPLFADQYSNIQTLVLKEMAVLLDIRDLNMEKIQHALNTVLNNPKYKLNAERLSRQFRDRLVPPLQTAVYWTEYVLRHQGAPHLRSKTADLPWYRFFLLDVAAVLLAFLLVAYHGSRFLLKYFMYCCQFGVFKRSKKSKND